MHPTAASEPKTNIHITTGADAFVNPLEANEKQQPIWNDARRNARAK